MKKDPLIFIKHILENIELVEEFSKGIKRKDLYDDKKLTYAIIRAIELIGEAMKNVPESLMKKYSKTPWKEIIGTRDKLIHHYFGVDLEIIYHIVKEDIPKLKKDIEKIIKENF